MIKEKLKKFISKRISKDNKKNIENLVVFLILLIITVIAVNIIWGKENKNQENISNYKLLAEETENKSNNIDKNEYDLESQLEDILCKIKGVGKTKVLITYSQTSSVIPMYSETESTSLTEETDSEGGKRKQETSNLNKEIVTNSNNDAITKTVVMPKVEGAIIIAEGGGNANIKTSIIQAVAAVTGIATYKVQVFEMNNN